MYNYMCVMLFISDIHYSHWGQYFLAIKLLLVDGTIIKHSFMIKSNIEQIQCVETWASYHSLKCKLVLMLT